VHVCKTEFWVIQQNRKYLRPPLTTRTEQLIAEAPLETAAADEDAPIDLFSSTFNVRPESRTDISRM